MATTENAGGPPLPSEAPTTEQSLWCVAAIIVGAPSPASEQQGPSGGTKHFKPGAKVYAIDWVPGDQDSLVALGHHRKSRQFLKASVSVSSVEHLRLEEVSIPTVSALARKHIANGGASLTQESAEAFLKSLLARQAEL